VAGREREEGAGGKDRKTETERGGGGGGMEGHRLTKGVGRRRGEGGWGGEEEEGLFEARFIRFEVNEVDAKRDRATLEVVVECGGSGVGRWRRYHGLAGSPRLTQLLGQSQQQFVGSTRRSEVGSTRRRPWRD